MRDALAFPDGGPPIEVTFGCEMRESGEIYAQAADGILGLGNNANALHSQARRGAARGATAAGAARARCMHACARQRARTDLCPTPRCHARAPQLAASGLVDRVFSLCFGFPSGGALLLGDVPPPPGVVLQHTALLPTKAPYYVVRLEAMEMGGARLPVDAVRAREGLGGTGAGGCRAGARRRRSAQ